MWETICEASASCSGWNFGSKIPVYPKLGFGPVYSTPHPTPKFEIWTGLGTFSFDYPTLPHPPPNLKFGQHLTLWVLTVPVFPLPLPKMKFGQDLAFWVLTTPVYLLPTTHPPLLDLPKIKIKIWTGLGTLSVDCPSCPPPPNEIWTGLMDHSEVRALPAGWRSGFTLPSLPPPPKLKFGQDLALWVLTVKVCRD